MHYVVRQSVYCLVLIAAWGLSAARAATTTVTFQNGLNQYVGTTDMFLVGTTANYGGAGSLQLVGEPGDTGFQGGLIRFGFAVGWGPDALPYGAVIESAVLRLYAYQKSSSVTVTACPMDRAWVEGSSNGVPEDNASCMSYQQYKSAGGSVNWGTDGQSHLGPVDGADYNSADVMLSLTKVTDSTPGWIEIDMTAIVQSWYNKAAYYSGRTNNGLYLYCKAGSADIYSSESTHTTLRPQLVITYQPMAFPNAAITPSSIQLPAPYTYGQVLAATRIHDGLSEMAGIDVPIVVGNLPAAAGAVVIGTHTSNAAVQGELASRFPPTGGTWIDRVHNYAAVAVVGDSGTIHIAANCDTALDDAALEWLKTLGLRYLFPDLSVQQPYGRYVPQLTTVPMDPCLSYYHAPGAAFRQVPYNGTGSGFRSGHHNCYDNYTHSPVSPLYRDHFRLIPGSHSYSVYLPIGTYFSAHPEWYALLDGVRGGGSPWQICFTNSDAAAQFAANMLPDIAEALAAGIPIDRIVIGMNPNDGLADCQCPNCQALYDSNGSRTSLVVNFANMVLDDVRQTYPGIHGSFYAYMNHFRPPEHVTLTTNLAAEACFWTDTRGAAANHAYPMFDAVHNAAFATGCDYYSSHAAALSLYTYYGNHITFTPYPYVTQISADLPGSGCKQSGLVRPVRRNHGQLGHAGGELLPGRADDVGQHAGPGSGDDRLLRQGLRTGRRRDADLSRDPAEPDEHA